MSNQQGAPPRGAPPPAGAYGPGLTVLGGSDQDAPPARDAGMPIPPTTVRDAYPDHGGAPVYPPPPPDLPPPYGAPGSPYGGDAHFDPTPPPAPIGVPPPPRGRGRGRSKGVPSLAIIGVISFVVIGSAVTAVALLTRPDGDEKPAPTVAVPVPASPPADPGAAAAPTEQPAAAPAGPAQRALPRPGQTRPAGRPARPGGNGPWPNGPNGPYNPRSPPRRPR